MYQRELTKNDPLKQANFVTEEVSDPYCRYIFRPVHKPVSLYQ